MSSFFLRLLDWVERDQKRSKFDRIVILKGMFDVKEFEVTQHELSWLKVMFLEDCVFRKSLLPQTKT